MESQHKEFWFDREDDEELAGLKALRAKAVTAKDIGDLLDTALASVGDVRGFRTEAAHGRVSSGDIASGVVDLEEMKVKIRAIEIRAYRKLGKTDSSIATILGITEREVAAVPDARE